MKKPSSSRSAKDHFIAHLIAENKQLREDLEYYRGRNANLDLALKEFGNEPQRAYAERVDREARQQQVERPIEQTPVAPPKSHFAQIREQWAAMTEEEQNIAIETGKMPT